MSCWYTVYTVYIVSRFTLFALFTTLLKLFALFTTLFKLFALLLPLILCSIKNLVRHHYSTLVAGLKSSIWLALVALFCNWWMGWDGLSYPLDYESTCGANNYKLSSAQGREARHREIPNMWLPKEYSSPVRGPGAWSKLSNLVIWEFGNKFRAKRVASLYVRKAASRESV